MLMKDLLKNVEENENVNIWKNQVGLIYLIKCDSTILGVSELESQHRMAQSAWAVEYTDSEAMVSQGKLCHRLLSDSIPGSFYSYPTFVLLL